MKNRLFNFIIGTLLVSGCGVAYTLDTDVKPYIGVHGQYNHYKIEDNRLSDGTQLIKKNGSGIGFNLGSKIIENFGLEIGYTQFKKSKTNVFFTRTVAVPGQGLVTVDVDINNIKHRNIYIDAMGYIPVAEDFDIVGLVGIGSLESKFKINGLVTTNAGAVAASIKNKSRKCGVRAGAGAKYMFNPNIGGRILVTYQKGNEVLDNVISAGLGIFYQF